jgi:hypothetical protein
MIYYHDEGSQTVYAVEDPPSATYHKNRGWYVSAQIHAIKASGYEGHNKTRFPSTTWTASETYPNPHDRKEDAIRFFRSKHLSDLGTKISEAEFKTISDRYEEYFRTHHT